jgi:chromosome segregation ATPase
MTKKKILKKRKSRRVKKGLRRSRRYGGGGDFYNLGEVLQDFEKRTNENHDLKTDIDNIELQIKKLKDRTQKLEIQYKTQTEYQKKHPNYSAIKNIINPTKDIHIPIPQQISEISKKIETLNSKLEQKQKDYTDGSSEADTLDNKIKERKAIVGPNKYDNEWDPFDGSFPREL